MDNINRSDTIPVILKELGLPPMPNETDRELQRPLLPSDYLGKDFVLDQDMREKIRRKTSSTLERFNRAFNGFKRYYESQGIFEHNDTDLNILFCDYLLFARQNGFGPFDYFGFEFWRKPLSEQNSFIGNDHVIGMLFVFQDYSSLKYLHNKAISNRVFADFIIRDWLDMTKCSIQEFMLFIQKHPKYFAKPAVGEGGYGVRAVQINENSDIEALFKESQERKLIIEEIITQHAALAEFCPDTLNTIRVNSILDTHNTVHILTANGRFGRVGNFVDNFHSGGYCVMIDPVTGVIVSDGINRAHERVVKHPDTNKTFRGFQYPFWDKVRAMVVKMARTVPSLKHVGWDIAINSAGEPEFVEGNEAPGSDIQQTADSVGKMHIYQPFIKEYEQYNREHFEIIGYKVNNIDDFESAYQKPATERNGRVQFAIDNLIGGCRSLLDVGCREDKFVKTLCPEKVKYYGVDYKKYDDETIECDFNTGNFPNITADTVLSIITAEYVELLPNFLDNLCRVALGQVLMICRPIDKEIFKGFRWRHPFAVDFTEKFLIDSMKKNNFYLHQMKCAPVNHSVILYDFRRK